MRLQTLRDEFDYFSQKLGDIVRNLAFSGIAVLWILSNSLPKIFESNILVSALLGFVITLILDILYYSYGSIVFDWYHNHLESKGVCENEEFAWSKGWTWPKKILRWTCVCACLASYIFLSIFIINQYNALSPK